MKSTNFRSFNSVTDTVPGKVMWVACCDGEVKVEYIGYDRGREIHVFRPFDGSSCISLSYTECITLVAVEEKVQDVWFVKAKAANFKNADPVVLIAFKTVDAAVAHIEKFYDVSTFEVVKGSVVVG